MKFRTYHAYTLAQALAGVKRDLGADAVILNTRTFKRGGLLGLGRRTIIEVTATPAKNQQRPTRNPPNAPPSTASNSAQRAYATAPQASRSIRQNALGTSSTVKRGADTVRDHQRRTQRLAMAVEEGQRRGAAAAVVPPSPLPVAQVAASDRRAVASAGKPVVAGGKVNRPPTIERTRHTLTPTTRGPIAPSPTIPVSPLASAARRFILQSPDIITSSASLEPAEVNSSAVSIAQEPLLAPNPAVHDELAAIKDMIGQVLHRQSPLSVSATMPRAIFDLRLMLLNQELSNEITDLVVNGVRDELDEAEQNELNLVRQAAIRQLARHILVARQPNLETPSFAAMPERRPITIALIGPTGVGKTTTLAKLAATFKLRHRKKVGLITADTYRIAAVEQLRTYAEIIDIPLHVSLTPDQMKQAVHSLLDCDVILIDTAGRSQNDASRLDELRQFITAAAPHEVHLVLSSTAGERVLLKEAEAFLEVGVQKMILTKLDEAASLGGMVNVIRKVGKPISFITTGQEVPEHLEVAESRRIADLVLGTQEVRGQPDCD